MKLSRLVFGVVIASAVPLSLVFAQTAPFSFQIQGATPTPSVSKAPTVPLALDAACVGTMSVSRTVDVGSSFNAIVKVKNIGTTTWNKNQGFLLGSQDPADNHVWGPGRGELSVNSVPTGATADIKLSLTAPTTPGDYSFRWRMVKEGTAWFGDTCSPYGDGKIKVIIPPNMASNTKTDVPVSVLTGQEFDATFNMQNGSRIVWSKLPDTRLFRGAYRLGSQQPQDNQVWGTGRVDFTALQTVNPGQVATFTVHATAPATSGDYAFRWQMVEEGKQWFGPVVGTTITVKPRDFDCTQSLKTIMPGQAVAFQCSNIPGTVSNLKWSAPSGTPTAGTGTSFTTSYAAAGTKTVVVSYTQSRSTKTYSYTVNVSSTPVPTPTSIITPTPTPTGLPTNPYDGQTPVPTVNQYDPTKVTPTPVPLTAKITSPAANASFALGQNIPVGVSGNGTPSCGYWTLRSPSGQRNDLYGKDFVSGKIPGNMHPCNEVYHDPY